MMVRLNVCVQDQSSYFTSLWAGDQEASFSSSQAKGWLTDLELVGNTGTGWGSVMVHRSVILPLCPYLAMMSLEDPKIIFTGVPLEVIKSVVQLIYTGECTLTPVCDVKSILDLMVCMGLFIQADRLQVVDSANNELSNSIIPQEGEFEEHLMYKIPVIVPVEEQGPGGNVDAVKFLALQDLVQVNAGQVQVQNDDVQGQTVKLNQVLYPIGGSKRRCKVCVRVCTKKEKDNLGKYRTQCQVCCRALCKKHRVQICENCAGLMSMSNT